MLIYIDAYLFIDFDFHHMHISYSAPLICLLLSPSMYLLAFFIRFKPSKGSTSLLSSYYFNRLYSPAFFILRLSLAISRFYLDFDSYPRPILIV